MPNSKCSLLARFEPKAASHKGEMPIKLNNFCNYKIVAHSGPINVYKAGLSGGRIW